MSDSDLKPTKISRAEARRLVARLEPALAAIALAADEAATAWCKAAHPVNTARYDTKSRGHKVATLWTEGVREWLLANRIPGLRLYSPYDWTEIIVRDRLHLSLARDVHFPASDRKRQRRNQQVDPMLELTIPGLQCGEVTNIDLIARRGDDGRMQSLAWTARNGTDQLWPEIEVDMRQARRLLHSWRRRGMPWLTTSTKYITLAQADAADQQNVRTLVAADSVGSASRLPAITSEGRRASWTGRVNPASDAQKANE